MKRLNETTFVAGQVTIDDISAAARADVEVVVNHRAPNEEPGQPTSVEMRDMAAHAGLRYVEIPVVGAPDESAVARTLEVMNSVRPGAAILLYCRSGMRSAAAWAMAERSRGADAGELRAAAAAAGYDLSRLPL